MSETKPPRLPACARGTDHRIDCGDHYWVRLVTRQAMRAEGECLQNCLRHGSYHDHAGPDDLTDSALWSLRRSEDAVSIALAMVCEGGHLTQFKGPYNNQVSGTGYRQLRALRDYLVMYGATLTFDEDEVLVADDGETYRPDKAPKEIREAIEAKEAARQAEREESYRLWREAHAQRQPRSTGIGLSEYQRAILENMRPPGEFILRPGRAFFRPQGQDHFEPLGEIDRIEIQADEAPQRPVVTETLVTEEDVRIARRYQPAFQDFNRLTERAWASSFVIDAGAAARLRSAWSRFIVDPTPTPAPRAAPDLTTRRGRTEAAMQRRQAQLADRRWVQENLREQRRARR